MPRRRGRNQEHLSISLTVMGPGWVEEGLRVSAVCARLWVHAHVGTKRADLGPSSLQGEEAPPPKASTLPCWGRNPPPTIPAKSGGEPVIREEILRSEFRALLLEGGCFYFSPSPIHLGVGAGKLMKILL